MTTGQLSLHAYLKGQWLGTTWIKVVKPFKCRNAFMISRQNKYFFLSEDFLENMNSNYRAEHRCLLTKPTTITAMSKNQQENHIPVYSKGSHSQSKLTPHKPKHRNLIVSHDLCSHSRLYWVLQIPGLPLKAIKFLALLGATKALTMKTCMLHSR